MSLIRYQSNPEDASQLVERLDGLLTDYELYHRNLRRIHWDQGLRAFLDFNDKLTKLYHITDNSKHQVAETLIALGGQPDLSDIEVAHLLPTTRIQALSEVRDFETATHSIVQNSQTLLEEVKEVFYLAAELQEPNTQQLMNMLAQQLRFTAAIFNGVRLAQLN